MFNEKKFVVSPIIVGGMSPQYRQDIPPLIGGGGDLFAPSTVLWHQEDFKGIFPEDRLRADHLAATAVYARAIRWRIDGFPHFTPPRVIFIRAKKEELERADKVLVKGYTYLDLPEGAPEGLFQMMDYKLPEGAQLTPFGRAWARLGYTLACSVDCYSTNKRDIFPPRRDVIRSRIDDFGLVMNKMLALGVCCPEAAQLLDELSPEIKNLHRLLVEAEKLGLDGFNPSDDEFKTWVGRIELALLWAVDALIMDV